MWDLDINAFYFHSLIFGSNETLMILDNIFKSGMILSINRGGYDSNNVRMNTKDEICLSKKNNLEISGSAYDLISKRKLSLIIKGSLPGVYSPKMVSSFDTESCIESGKTQLMGEYRIKNEIPLDYVVGLNLPVKFILSSNYGYKYFVSTSEEFAKVDFISKKKRYNYVIEFYDSIRDIMNKNNVYLSVYDVESEIKIKDYSDIEKIKKKI